MSRFTLGTVSANAARLAVVFLVLFGVIYLWFLPLVVYAVPCSAAFKKSPRRFWRTFTVASVVLAVIATAFCTYGFSRELDGIPVIGFPLPHPTAESALVSLPFAINAVLASGCCLLPLSLFSTLDTFRKQNRMANAPVSIRR